jgi:hypothetical protein
MALSTTYTLSYQSAQLLAFFDLEDCAGQFVFDTLRGDRFYDTYALALPLPPFGPTWHKDEQVRILGLKP